MTITLVCTVYKASASLPYTLPLGETEHLGPTIRWVLQWYRQTVTRGHNQESYASHFAVRSRLSNQSNLLEAIRVKLLGRVAFIGCGLAGNSSRHKRWR